MASQRRSRAKDVADTPLGVERLKEATRYLLEVAAEWSGARADAADLTPEDDILALDRSAFLKNIVNAILRHRDRRRRFVQQVRLADVTRRAIAMIESEELAPEERGRLAQELDRDACSYTMGLGLAPGEVAGWIGDATARIHLETKAAERLKISVRAFRDLISVLNDRTLSRGAIKLPRQAKRLFTDSEAIPPETLGYMLSVLPLAAEAKRKIEKSIVEAFAWRAAAGNDGA